MLYRAAAEGLTKDYAVVLEAEREIERPVDHGVVTRDAEVDLRCGLLGRRPCAR